MQGGARFVLMPVHDQIDGPGVMGGRPRMVVSFTGEMRNEDHARRPWEQERGEHRRR